MCVLHHRPICRINGRSIKWFKEVRKNNMPVNGMFTELAIDIEKDICVKLISMVRHNGSWSFIITFFQLSLLVSILSFMMWSDEPGRIIPKNCKSYAQNPRKTLLWMDSTYELPIKRVTHTHFPSKSVISQKKMAQILTMAEEFLHGFHPPIPRGVESSSPGYAPLAAESFEMGFAQIQRRTTRLFSVAVCAVMWVGAVMELLTQKKMGVVDGQAIEKNGPFRKLKKWSWWTWCVLGCFLVFKSSLRSKYLAQETWS